MAGSARVPHAKSRNDSRTAARARYCNGFLAAGPLRPNPPLCKSGTHGLAGKAAERDGPIGQSTEQELSPRGADFWSFLAGSAAA
jgi:hypothetical protein